jgi:hypothetical protein
MKVITHFTRYVMHKRRYKRLRVAAIFLAPMLFLGIFFHQVFASLYGVPPGYTGSPYDGVTCATLGCHNGPVTNVTGLIQTDIPPTGFNPSDTYNISLSVSRPATDIFGFQITIGDQYFPRGEFLITDPTGTQYSVSNQYVTHRETGSSGVNQKTWQMQWVAPDWPVEEPLAIYASLVAGIFLVDDEVLKTTLPLTINQHIHENNSSGDNVLGVFPNPFNEWLVLQWDTEQRSIGQVQIYNSNGALTSTVVIPDPGQGKHMIHTGILPPGIYFVEVGKESNRVVYKVIKSAK